MKTTALRIFPAGALAFTLLLPPPAVAQETDPDLQQRRLHFETKLTRPLHFGYLLYLPPDYDPRATKKWPLMLFLHGAGERGTNLPLVAVHGPPKLVKKSPAAPANESPETRSNREAATEKLARNFIVISPQCPAGERWETDALLSLLDHVIAAHHVDTTRVYLTGLSMGGYGSWALATRHPERFAAVAPICGGGERIDILLAARTKAAVLKTLPVWAFHGAKDSVVPLAESERMIEALKRAGSQNVQLTIYPEAQHDSWTATYNNPQLYDWFLSHQRK